MLSHLFNELTMKQDVPTCMNHIVRNMIIINRLRCANRWESVGQRVSRKTIKLLLELTLTPEVIHICRHILRSLATIRWLPSFVVVCVRYSSLPNIDFVGIGRGGGVRLTPLTNNKIYYCQCWNKILLLLLRSAS